jgi:hypothetical protein
VSRVVEACLDWAIWNPFDVSPLKHRRPLIHWGHEEIKSDSKAYSYLPEGPRGGRVLSYDNVGRMLTNTEFIALVANAWVGTTIPQWALLEKAIREVVETGKTITLAIKQQAQSSDGVHNDLSSIITGDERVDL